MRTTGCLVTCLVAMTLASGCKRSNEVTVTQYGPEYMTLRGDAGPFDEACRTVLHKLSYKEQVEDDKTRYPHYGEGVSTHKDGDRYIAIRAYMKTQDEEGAEYKITTIRLGTRDPVVVLESTSSDRYRLINALNTELHKRGIRVRQY